MIVHDVVTAVNILGGKTTAASSAARKLHTQKQPDDETEKKIRLTVEPTASTEFVQNYYRL